jgi:hypothetical protein
LKEEGVVNSDKMKGDKGEEQNDGGTEGQLRRK